MRHTILLVAGLIATLLVVTACGSDDTRSTAQKVEPSGPREVDAPTPDADLTTAMGDAGTKLTDAGCAYGSYKLGSAKHIDVGDDLKSPTFPPNSGRHFASWAPYGLYDKPIDDGYAVHNLEHGGVVVWLGTETDDATRDAVAGLLDDDEKWVVAPRPDIAGLFSAAWGLGLTCSPEALTKLGPEALAKDLDAWYETVESTGSPAEKDLPAYAGGMKEPTPVKDISTDTQF